jgi:hypothetical protein
VLSVFFVAFVMESFIILCVYLKVVSIKNAEIKF